MGMTPQPARRRFIMIAYTIHGITQFFVAMFKVRSTDAVSLIIIHDARCELLNTIVIQGRWYGRIVISKL
jgi:hypothetical protein